MGPGYDWNALLRCPTDRQALRWQPDVPGSGINAATGTLRCAACGGSYPAADGIVRFLQDSLDDEVKASEMRARDAAAVEQRPAVEEGLLVEEAAACLEAMAPAPTHVVVDLGCGTGRILRQYLDHVSCVVALDFSCESLRVLRRSLTEEQRTRVLLVQCDISAPPIAFGVFDRVMSSQVLEHLPTPAMRAMAFRLVAELLTPDGRATLTVYHWSWHKRREARYSRGDYVHKEGRHGSNIYYYNFEVPELMTLMAQANLEVDLVQGIDLGIPGSRFLGPLEKPLLRALSTWRVGHRFAHLVLCRARRHSAAATPAAPSGRGA